MKDIVKHVAHLHKLKAYQNTENSNDVKVHIRLLSLGTLGKKIGHVTLQIMRHHPRIPHEDGSILVFYVVLRNNLTVSVSRDGKDPAMGSCLLVGKKTLRYKDRPTITINCAMMNLIQRHERLIGAVPTSFDKSRIPFSGCL